MFKIFLCAVLVAVAVADPCCTPQQWEGRAGSITGTVTMGTSMTTEVNAAISYDFMNKMLAVSFEYTLKDMLFKNKTIINYNTKQMFMINNMNQACTVQMVDMNMMEACVPPGSQETGPFYYGAGANNMLQAKAYKFMMKVNDKDEIKGDVAVTEMDCIPIAEVVYGRVGTTDMMSTVGFVDITPGIKDPSVFDPPAVCSQVKGPPLKFSQTSFMGMPSLH